MPPSFQQQQVHSVFWVVVGAPLNKTSNVLHALVQSMQLKICTENSLNIWNIMSFVKKSQEEKIVFKPSCGFSAVKQRNVRAGNREHRSSPRRRLTDTGRLSRPRRCPGLLWPTGSGSWAPAGPFPTGHPELSGKGWKSCRDLCHSSTWSAPSSLLYTATATPGRERKED